MRFDRWLRTRGWGPVALGVGAAAIVFTDASGDGIQTAAGCAGDGSNSDEWIEIQASGATDTWSLDGFHYWVGLPAGWSGGLPASLDDLPNTQVEVVDGDGDPIAGHLGFHKIRRQAVVLTWRADSELAPGSTLRSTLVFGPEEYQTREQTLTVADAGKPLEFPEVQTVDWVTETWTEGPAVDCSYSGECTEPLHEDEVSALTWRLHWTVMPTAPWSFELVMTKGNAIQALGPQWVGQRSWARGSIGLHLEPADEYCFQIVGTDFSSGSSVKSPETCSAPGTPTEDIFLDLDSLLDCDSVPEDESLAKRWCELNPEHEDCGGPTQTGGTGGTGGGSSNSGGSAGTAVNTNTTSANTGSGGAVNTGGSGGGDASGGSAGSLQTGGSGGSRAAGGSGVTGGEEVQEARLSKGGCWCSVPRPPTGAHGVWSLAALALLGFRRRRA